MSKDDGRVSNRMVNCHVADVPEEKPDRVQLVGKAMEVSAHLACQEVAGVYQLLRHGQDEGSQPMDVHGQCTPCHHR